MITDNIYHQKLVSDYIDHGFAPIPIGYKSKQSVNKGWPELRISHNDIGAYFNEQPINIGILTGQPSQRTSRYRHRRHRCLEICSMVSARNEMRLWSSIEAKISLGLSSSEA